MSGPTMNNNRFPRALCTRRAVLEGAGGLAGFGLAGRLFAQPNAANRPPAPTFPGL